MKKITTVATISLALVLSACTSTTQEPNSQANQQESTQGNQQINQPATENSSTTPVPELENDADIEALNDAVLKRDVSLCSSVSSELVSLCQNRVKDAIAVDQAVEDLDPEKCSELSNPAAEQSCRESVQQLAMEEGQRQQESQSGQNDVESMESIIAREDYQACSNLTLETSVHSCELSILTTKAINEEDSSWCERATSEERVAVCLEDYEQEMEIRSL